LPWVYGYTPEFVRVVTRFPHFFDALAGQNRESSAAALAGRPGPSYIGRRIRDNKRALPPGPRRPAG